jgi:hypothetical protein
MRKLIASFLISFNLMAAPTGYKNETATVPTYTQNLVAPNNQFTKQAGLDSRIETGNENLLANPSFEAATASTSWTKTGPTNTFTDETTSKVSGKKSLKFGIVTTSATGVRQDSTINASDLAGLQGAVSIYVKTAITGVQVCPRADGAVVTASCMNVLSDNVWHNYIIATTLSGTSNGIEIQRTSLTTGDVYLDNAFVGLSSPFQNVGGAKLVGTVTITGCASEWTTSSTSYVDFPVQTGCVYTTSGQALAPSTMIPAIKFASLPAGDYKLEYEGGLHNNVAGQNSYYQFWDGTNTAREQTYNNGQGSTINNTSSISQTISYSASQSNITLSIRGKQVSAGNVYIGGMTAFPGTIKVWYFPPESKIYSQASQDYAYTNAGTITIGATTTAPTKGTTVVDRIMASRKGQNLLAKYQYEQSGAGSAGSGDYLFSLPSGLSFDANLITPYSGGVGAQVSGLGKSVVGYGKASGDITPSHSALLIAYDSTRFRVLVTYSTGGHSFVQNAAWSLGNSTASFSLNLDAPISGWQDYGVIVGSFAGIEKCANDYECTDTFSAKVDTSGVVTNQNIPWISGTCSVSLGAIGCNLISGLKDGVSNLSSPLNCTAIVTDTVASNAYGVKQNPNTTTTTAVGFTSINTNSGSATSLPILIKCQKGTNDYKPKTAKVATSIGIPTVPGITTTGSGNLIDTFSFSYGTTNATTVCSASPCSYLDQIGSAVTSVTRTGTGAYTINFGKTYTKLKCTSSSVGAVAGTQDPITCTSSCSSVSFITRATTTGSAQDNYGTVYCQGSY